MKIVTQEEVQAHNSATIRGATEGFLGSAAFAVPASFVLHRRWAYYRSLPLPLKVAGVVMLIAPAVSIQAERRGLEFDKASWTGAGRMELDRVAAEEDARWNTLSTGEKFRDWATRHQYSIIIGSWALSMAVAGAIISRDKYQSLPQKVVQARVWAQGLTIGVLIAAGALTHQNRQDAVSMRRAPTDHSWQTFLEEQEREKQAQISTLQHSASHTA
ncbi:hypothetical protein HYDPIDRAFT_114736 [Hydnomerulius pinastri MD-312]|uniref:HIG1 domain-containing protein n=1 Tax=Hydnomerulius pinastri MD-312 TaxID=994086 RepID=A0A0C9W630_9AGAM|nr:hypothetical protein HYDPIDRAFT_114736 [Hydnomerulius pinastri MD-312]